jgi:hypothetical protein
MATGEKIVFTNDLDGVHFVAPPPAKTALSLLRGKLSIPEIGQEPSPFQRGNRIVEGASWVSHRFRPLRKDAMVGLEMFVNAARAYDREMRVAILSGRQGVLHTLTNRRLERAKRMEFFHDVYLNESDSSSGWKEATVHRLLEEGNSVVHIDDDLRPALRIARLDENIDNPRVLVYLLKNLSNHPSLLKRAGVELPVNVVQVRDFRDAGIDFSQRLRKGKF